MAKLDLPLEQRDDSARERLVSNLTREFKVGLSEKIPAGVIRQWRNVDKRLH